ncbi:hypothetical protein PTKIN_Ptkin13bG0290300 [Pterospermum kingtungense]
MEQSEPRVPHVVFLPFPALGHIKPMLELAQLLSHAGFQVTFINTKHIHQRFLSTGVLAQYPEFQFLTIPDGLPRDHPRTGSSLADVLLSQVASIKPALREHLLSLCKKNEPWQPASCIIEDGILSSAVIDVAEEFQIPVFALRTSSACCIWTYFHLPKLIEEGDVPVLQDKDMDKTVTCIPGLENVVRRRDLPGIFRIEKADDPGLEFFINDQTLVMPRAFAVIINTCDALEAPMISKLGSVLTKIYAVGPLHALSNTRIKDLTNLASSKSIVFEEDRGCMAWLDSQFPKSVVFVSFGSLIGLTRDNALEFGHGLVNSGKPFLWVIRPDSIKEEADPSLILGELKDMMEDNPGLIVSWAPQEEVLAHPAIGVFLTHSGWNSTLESIYVGVPMICWPGIGDQQINSRFVSDVWKIGTDMKDTCDRSKIERMVKDLIEDKREEIMKSMDEITRKVQDGVKEGGSSYCNLDKLIEDIRSMLVTRDGKNTCTNLPFPCPRPHQANALPSRASLQAGLHVTFLNTHHNHYRVSNLSLQDLSSSHSFPHPSFRVYIRYGLPDLVHSIKSVTKPLLRDFLSLYSDIPPVSCIVADGILSFALMLTEQGELPFSASFVTGNDTDRPYSFGSKQLEDPKFQFFVSETQAKSRLGHNLSQLSSSNGNLKKPDRDGITWLDSQPSRSVVYVSFGSYVVLTSEELLEFWQELVNCGKRFLWPLRPDISDQNDMIGLGTKGKDAL